MSRKIKYRRGGTALLVISIILIIGLGVFSAFEFFRADSLSKDLAQTQQDSAALSDELETLKGQNQDLQNDNDSLKNQLGTLQDQFKDLQNQITANQTSVNEQESDGNKVAYLTFDDGPTGVTSHLLDVLNDLNVKATFFVAFDGSDTPEKRAILKQEAMDGHVVGVHTWTHDYYTIYKNEQNFLEDFNKTKQIITEATGITPNVSRFPGGASNTVSITASGGEEIMPRLADLVHGMGFQFFDWNAGGYDAEIPYPTAGELANKVIRDAEGRDTVVILLHDTHGFTVEAVPDIVKGLRGQGYTFKTLNPNSPAIQQPFAKSKKS
jgi:peptidoglycan/xylan/chitin deacetylase (PgdA/CDA1 family)